MVLQGLGHPLGDGERLEGEDEGVKVDASDDNADVHDLV